PGGERTNPFLGEHLVAITAWTARTDLARERGAGLSFGRYFVNNENLPKGGAHRLAPRAAAGEASMNARLSIVAILLAGAGAGVLLSVPACKSNKDAPPPDKAPPAGPPLFRDMTADSGVQAVYKNGEEAGHYAILESLGGGIVLFDFDGDGLIDIFIPCGGYFDGEKKQDIKGYPSKLYKNLGNWKFKDVTAEVG